MTEEAKSVKPETTKPADLVYVGGKDRKYKDGAKGEWWEATRDPKRAMRWALASSQGSHRITVRALQLGTNYRAGCGCMRPKLKKSGRGQCRWSMGLGQQSCKPCKRWQRSGGRMSNMNADRGLARWQG